jgi:hypothetical protein
VPQDKLLSSADNVQLRSGIQNTPGDENGTGLNVANQENEAVRYSDFCSTLVAASAPPFVCTVNAQRQYIEDDSLPSPLQLLT